MFPTKGRLRCVCRCLLARHRAHEARCGAVPPPHRATASANFKVQAQFPRRRRILNAVVSAPRSVLRNLLGAPSNGAARSDRRRTLGTQRQAFTGRRSGDGCFLLDWLTRKPVQARSADYGVTVHELQQRRGARSEASAKRDWTTARGATPTEGICRPAAAALARPSRCRSLRADVRSCAGARSDATARPKGWAIMAAPRRVVSVRTTAGQACTDQSPRASALGPSSRQTVDGDRRGVGSQRLVVPQLDLSKGANRSDWLSLDPRASHFVLGKPAAQPAFGGAGSGAVGRHDGQCQRPCVAAARLG